jgi:aromatic-L-amino-acid/L-tryptophan decarboxylase
MPENLAIPAEQIREMGRAALDLVADYYETLAARPVLRPTTSAALRALIDEPPPPGPTPFPELLDGLRATVVEYSRHNAHPRFFGYVSSPGNPVNTIGGLIAAALNINVTCWRSGPAAAEIELLTIRWLKQLLGFPEEAAGLLVSGGSMANFAGLAAARSAKFSNVVREGISAAARPRLYCSSEAHFSIRKAAALLGLGTDSVRQVRVDASLRMEVADLARLVDEDRAAGHQPFCVVASAGTAGTGAIDPIGPIADFARAHDLWFHIDGAYGGIAAIAPSAREAFARLGEADSLSLDPHKWLYLPTGCGCVLYREPATARAAFSENADYTRIVGLEHDEAFAFWDYGPELSRPFRALDLWLLMKSVGVTALGEAIEENIACARHLAALVNASDDFEMLAPVDLSIFCFRYKKFDGDLNAFNERLMVALQHSGNSYLSNTTVHGKFALRGCVLNYRTTRRDMEVLLEDLRSEAQKLRHSAR